MKYNALLEGLEAVEIRKSNITNHFRLDSEFFKKEYLAIESRLVEIGCEKLDSISKLYDGPFGSDFLSSGYVNQGVPIIRMQNIKENGLFDENEIEFVTEEDADNLSKHIAYPGEVVTTKIGFLGYTTVLPDLFPRYVFRREITRIQLQTKLISTFYLSTFLNSEYGRKQFYRYASGTTRDRVLLTNQRETLIPMMSEVFQKKIETLLTKSYDLRERAKLTYNEADSFLLEEIGLKEFEPSCDPINIVSYKESFLNSGRLDSEFYQLKYEDYLKLIYTYPHGYESVKYACNVKDNNFMPEEMAIYKYIELANIGETGEIKGCTEAVGSELPTRARRKVKTNDVIISSIEGSLKSCAIVSIEYDNALCSTGFYVINSETINSETLLVLFKSEPMQNILKQKCSGTILTSINKDDFLKIPLPNIESSIQLTIKLKVNESNQYRMKSENLLKVAKRAVEIAIEKDEMFAFNFIEKNITELSME